MPPGLLLTNHQPGPRWRTDPADHRPGADEPRPRSDVPGANDHLQTDGAARGERQGLLAGAEDGWKGWMVGRSYGKMAEMMEESMKWV